MGTGVMKTYNDTTLDEYVVYSCLEYYYYISGTLVRRCEEEGIWSVGDTVLCEQRKCSSLQSIENGWYKPVKISYTPGDIVLYSCNTHFNLLGMSLTICVDGGRWSESHPFCVPVLCPSLNVSGMENMNVQVNPYFYCFSFISIGKCNIYVQY